MPPLIPCPGCARHVYSSEVSCPFCEQVLPRSRRLGLGLAAAASAGLALVATGCPGNSESNPDTQVHGAPEPDLPVAIPEYGAPPPPPVEPAPDEPDDYREAMPKYGAPPPPPDQVKPQDDPPPGPDAPR